MAGTQWWAAAGEAGAVKLNPKLTFTILAPAGPKPRSVAARFTEEKKAAAAAAGAAPAAEVPAKEATDAKAEVSHWQQALDLLGVCVCKRARC